MRINCYILNLCRILSFFGIKRDVRVEDKDYKYLKDEFEISEVKIKNNIGSHFMATNNTEVLYDPLFLKDRGKIEDKNIILNLSVYLEKYNLLHICIYY
ncbi:hypothetical protein BDCR2A_01585 [Borrelia duttonii CR2A]|uniref:Uncharacterized protein n=1 Tax=Borrelia duttonii CR2A TaxID=1432657 RepID=W6TWK8_9SPIR|nr:DUF261 family protein [Borrelia duttonii]ETZ17486.1 hypothetical protein BDCR2A_01585 [Borrelia duttonii CR2A]